MGGGICRRRSSGTWCIRWRTCWPPSRFIWGTCCPLTGTHRKTTWHLPGKAKAFWCRSRRRSQQWPSARRRPKAGVLWKLRRRRRRKRRALPWLHQLVCFVEYNSAPTGPAGFRRLGFFISTQVQCTVRFEAQSLPDVDGPGAGRTLFSFGSSKREAGNYDQAEPSEGHLESEYHETEWLRIAAAQREYSLFPAAERHCTAHGIGVDGRHSADYAGGAGRPDKIEARLESFLAAAGYRARKQSLERRRAAASDVQRPAGGRLSQPIGQAAGGAGPDGRRPISFPIQVRKRSRHQRLRAARRIRVHQPWGH